MDYVHLSTNVYIHHVRLSRNSYVHYVRLSTSLKDNNDRLLVIVFGYDLSFHIDILLIANAFWWPLSFGGDRL